ncbi:unnamed protein product, partial [Brenthis ino]
MEEEAKEAEFERRLNQRTFVKAGSSASKVRKAGTSVPTDSEASASEAPAPRDPAELTADELRALASSSVAAVYEVAQKSGNLKGTMVKMLKESAATLQKVVEALAGRTVGGGGPPPPEGQRSPSS